MVNENKKWWNELPFVYSSGLYLSFLVHLNLSSTTPNSSQSKGKNS